MSRLNVVRYRRIVVLCRKTNWIQQEPGAFLPRHWHREMTVTSTRWCQPVMRSVDGAVDLTHPPACVISHESD